MIEEAFMEQLTPQDFSEALALAERG